MAVTHSAPHKARPLRRLEGAGSNQIASGRAYANTNKKYYIVPCAGASNVRVRTLVTGANATIDAKFLGPDFDPTQGDSNVAYASLVGTQYASGNPVQVALTADTENKIDIAVNGESFLLILITGGGTGSITYCDVSFLSAMVTA